MCSAKNKELIEVVKYFRDEFDDLWRKHLAVTRDTGLEMVATGLKIAQQGLREKQARGKGRNFVYKI